MDNMKIPLLINSFSKRKDFLEIFFYSFEKNFNLPVDVYLTIDASDFLIKTNIDINLLYYDDIIDTSTEMHLTHSRYYRHYYSMLYFKNMGYEYIFNYMDDAWVSYCDSDKIVHLLKYLTELNADRLDITGVEPGYELINFNSEISIINSNNNLPWYHTNQPSIWKLNSLIKLYELLGPSADTNVERNGSFLCRKHNYKFLCSNEILLKEKGTFQRNAGLNSAGKCILKQFCLDKNLNFNDMINKFNGFI